MNVNVQKLSLGDGESSIRTIAEKLHTLSVSPHLIPEIIIAPMKVVRAHIDVYGMALNNERQDEMKSGTQEKLLKNERRDHKTRFLWKAPIYLLTYFFIDVLSECEGSFSTKERLKLKSILIG